MHPDRSGSSSAVANRLHLRQNFIRLRSRYPGHNYYGPTRDPFCIITDKSLFVKDFIKKIIIGIGREEGKQRAMDKKERKGESRVFELHVRYICIISLLAVIAAVCLVTTDIFTRSLRKEAKLTESRFVSGFGDSVGLLASGLSEASEESDPYMFSSYMSDAVSVCGRIIGTADAYGKLNSRLLEKYLAELSEKCRRMQEKAIGDLFVDEESKKTCSDCAGQVVRILTDGKQNGNYSADLIDLMLSPLIPASN